MAQQCFNLFLLLRAKMLLSTAILAAHNRRGAGTSNPGLLVANLPAKLLDALLQVHEDASDAFATLQ